MSEYLSITESMNPPNCETLPEALATAPSIESMNPEASVAAAASNSNHLVAGATRKRAAAMSERRKPRRLRPAGGTPLLESC